MLRALTRSPDSRAQEMNLAAGELLRRAERGEVDVTTSDAVIAEVAFILTSKAHYQQSVVDTAGKIGTILRLRGFKRREKQVLLRALDLWTEKPKLGFVDALTAAYAQQPGVELATFDTDFDDIPDITRWSPETI